MIYLLINRETGRVAGSTSVTPFDSDCDISDAELLDARLEAAIADGYISDGAYEWVQGRKLKGVYL